MPSKKKVSKKIKVPRKRVKREKKEKKVKSKFALPSWLSLKNFGILISILGVAGTIYYLTENPDKIKHIANVIKSGPTAPRAYIEAPVLDFENVSDDESRKLARELERSMSEDEDEDEKYEDAVEHLNENDFREMSRGIADRAVRYSEIGQLSRGIADRAIDLAVRKPEIIKKEAEFLHMEDLAKITQALGLESKLETKDRTVSRILKENPFFDFSVANKKRREINASDKEKRDQRKKEAKEMEKRIKGKKG